MYIYLYILYIYDRYRYYLYTIYQSFSSDYLAPTQVHWVMSSRLSHRWYMFAPRLNRIRRRNKCGPYRSLSSETESKVDAGSKVCGWIRSFRHHKNISFLDISDGTTSENLQVVVDKNVRGNVTDLKYGAAVQAVGQLESSPAAGQKYEFKADSLELLGTNDADTFPFAKNTRSYTPDYNRQFLHLRSKLPEFAALLRLRSYCKKLIHDYFHKRDFVQIDTPVFTANDCEGAGDLFSVSTWNKTDPYFGGQKVNLTVSGQLHLEACNSGRT